MAAQQLAERLRVRHIKAPSASAPLGDQPCLSQCFQVLRDSRAADRQALGNRRDRPRRGEDALENQPPRRIGECGQSRFVSHDLR
jgi:hypothetical protein